MKKFFIGCLLLVGLICVTGMGGCVYVVGMYNGIQVQDEAVDEQWSQVESAYQRRNDLIPNLVSTVKGYAAHEKGTLESVIKARQQVNKINIDAKALAGGLAANPEMMGQMRAAQDGLTSALSRLMVVVEKYPDLKADQQFLNLQHELSGTENRINTWRQRYNKSVGDINKRIRRFPDKMVADWAGVESRNYFKSQEGSDQAPVVNFGDAPKVEQ